MKGRRCKWVTADGTMAVLSTIVRSTHHTWEGAQRAASKARLEGHPREVVSAMVMAEMQNGASHTSAIQTVAGCQIESATVWVM